MAETSFKKIIGNNDESCVSVILPKKKDYFSSSIEVLKYLIKDKGLKGVVVTLNRPYKNLKKTLDLKKIDSDNVFFIDCSTRLCDNKDCNPERIDNVLYMAGPHNLSGINIAIDQALNAFGDSDKFLFFDSLSTLMIYFKVNTVSQFVHFLTSKLRNENVKGVLIMLEKDMAERLGCVVQQLSDNVLEV